MTDIEKINEFLNREDLNPTEKIIKEQCSQLDKRLKISKRELEVLGKEYSSKENEVLVLTHQFEGALKLILELCNEKKEEEKND